MSKEIQLSVAMKVDEYTNNSCRILRNDVEPYTAFCAKDIGIILGLENIRNNSLLENDKITFSTMTSTGPKQITYLNYTGLLKILTKSRKRRATEFANAIGIDMSFITFACIEASSIERIITTFRGELMIEQYKIDAYIIDLYFPKYRLVIECDEKHHKNIINWTKDKDRETHISTLLNCSFIRYEPFVENFNIFELLNRIFSHINSVNSHTNVHV